VDFTADNTTFTQVLGVPGSPDFETQQVHWTDPSMFVHFAAGQSDATLNLHVTADHVAEGAEAFAVQFDFAANGSHVQYDGAQSQADYVALGGDSTQFNIGHLVDA
jgi:hypothetical protein